ncbi:MAG: AMP-binding protein [Gordonia polyisoprenivorans]|nr:AMP-binding protein [Gordonia polyisoprenivorans]
MYPEYWAAQHPDKPAVVIADTGAMTTFEQLDQNSRRFAHLLHDKGIGVGDHVAVLLENRTEFIDVVWGCLLAGVHISPISRYVTADEAGYILRDCGAKAFVTSTQVRKSVEHLPEGNHFVDVWLNVDDDAMPGYTSYHDALNSASGEPISPDAPLGEYMLYSSGTTGRPKGVARKLSGRAVKDGSNANRFLSKIFGVDDSSVYLSPAPLYHGAPLGFTIGATSLGATAVLLTKFEAQHALQAIDDHRVTHSQWVPTMFTRMLQLPEEVRHRYTLETQRVAIHSAAPCPRHVKEAMFEWWGPVLHEYYSGTEDVGVTYAGPQDWLTHPGTVGRPLGFTIHICDESGAELGPGETGLVYFETRREPFRYHGDEAKTRDSRHPSHANWVTLDDIGHLDDDGFLYLTDRASFMIISGGVNIYPREIEDVLSEHPAVADVAVIGVPSTTDMGEDVMAIVELRPGHSRSEDTEREILEFAGKKLAGPKRPRSVDFMDHLPRLATGKLAKKQIRQPYWAGN